MSFLWSLCAADPGGALKLILTRRNRHSSFSSFSSFERTQVLTDAETLWNSNKCPSDSQQEERERGREEKKEREIQSDNSAFDPAVISRVFPTYPLYTTSKRFALWNHSCDIRANGGTACEMFKQRANDGAGKRKVGVSAWFGSGAQLRGCWADSSPQLGCSASCTDPYKPYNHCHDFTLFHK